MKTKILKILILTTTIATIAIAHGVLASAPSTISTHMSAYTAKPGEVVKGQVVIMNPTNEVKVINAHVAGSTSECDNCIIDNNIANLFNPDLERCTSKQTGFVNIPQPDHKISANQKLVVRYEIGVPEDITEGCYETIHLQENSPSNKLSLLHTVVIQTDEEVSILKSSAFLEASFSKTATVLAIVSLALGLALATKYGTGYLKKKRKPRKRKK